MGVLLTEINRFTAFREFIAAPKLETDLSPPSRAD